MENRVWDLLPKSYIYQLYGRCFFKIITVATKFRGCKIYNFALRLTQGAKVFAFLELRTVFGKLQIKIINFLENCKSTFFDA